MATGWRWRWGSQNLYAAVVLVLTVGQWPHVGSWRTWGVLPSDSEFVEYVGKFCFDSSKTEEAGIFSFIVGGLVQEGRLPPGSPPPIIQPASPCWGPCDPTGGLYLIVYDDEKAHWRKAHRSWQTLTCKERLEDASWATRVSPLPSKGVVNRTVFVSEKVRPRFWYFSFVACGVDGFPQPVKYEIHTENILTGIQIEYGVDDEGMLHLQLFFTAVFIAFSFYLRVIAKQRGQGETFRARPLLRLLVLAVTFSAAGCALQSLHYLFFTFNGSGIAFFEVVGVIFGTLSKACITILSLLAAKGWVLFYSQNEIPWRRFTVCTLGSIVIATIVCEIHGQYFHDSRTTLYLYESGPGMFILFLNLVLFMEAIRSMYSTYWHEVSDEVKEFYRTVTLSITVYYITLPVICILAVLFDPWVRRKYVARTELFARFLAMALLAYCLRPSRLDLIINSRLEEGLDSDLCDSDNPEIEGCGDDSDHDNCEAEEKRGLTENMERNYEDEE